MSDVSLEKPKVSEQELSDRKLKKALSFQDLFFLSMGGIIGSGWLLAVIAAASVAGPAVILSWIIGGILILFVALNYAEISGMIPRSGAIVRYPGMTHGSLTGYVLAWAYLLSAITVPTIEAEGAITYLSTFKRFASLTLVSNGVTVLSAYGIGVAVVLLVVFFLMNYFGVKLLGTFNTVITWWKFIIPGLTIVLLFFAFKSQNFTGGNFFGLGVDKMFLAIPTTGIVFSYLGFRQALDFGGEAKNPQKDIPRATIFSVIAATILYTLLQVAFNGSINWGNAKVGFFNWSALSASSWASAPLYNDLQAAGFAVMFYFAFFLIADAVISPSGTGVVYTGTSSRTVYGMAIGDFLPKFMKQVDAKTGIPVGALIVSIVFGAIFLLPLPSWYLLVGFISSATVLTYVSGGISLMVLRKTAAGLHRPYKLPMASVIAPLGVLASIFIVYWSGTTTLTFIVAAVFIGLPLFTWFYAPQKLGLNRAYGVILGLLFLAAWVVTNYFGPLGTTNSIGFVEYFALEAVEVAAFIIALYYGVNEASKQEVLAGNWVITLIFGVYFLSYLGPFGPNGNSPVLMFPWDNLVVGMFGFGMYAWAVSSGISTPEIESIVEEATAKAGVSVTASEE